MAELEQKIRTDDTPLCNMCPSNEVRRAKAMLFDRLFCLQPFVCCRCGNRHREFDLDWTVFPKLLTLLCLIAGATYLWLDPPLFLRREVAPTSEAEALARSRAAMGGQLSTFEQMMTRKPKGTLDNATVLRLWRANVGANVILQMIRTSNGEYDVSANAIIVLRESQVDQGIILAMIDANYNAR